MEKTSAAITGGDVYPLDANQERLWFLQNLDTEGPAFGYVTAIAVKGELDIDRLKDSLKKVIANHRVLSTVFVEHDGYPICKTITPDIDSVLSISEAISAEDYEKRFIQHRYDLQNGPLFRVDVLNPKGDSPSIWVGMHALIGSRATLWQFINALAAEYGGSVATASGSDYADFVNWQRSVYDESANKAWWQSQLADVPGALEFPIDRVRPAAQSLRVGYHSFTLSPAMSEQVRQLARAQSVSVEDILRAVFAVQLFRYTATEDLLFGVTAENQPFKSEQPLLGHLENTLPLRLNLATIQPFMDFVHQVNATYSQAAEHYLPFANLLSGMNLERDLSRAPLVQVHFAYDDQYAASISAGDVVFMPHDIKRTAQLFDLSLTCWQDAEVIHGAFEYALDLFDPETLDRLVRHFHVLLEDALKSPNKKISHLEILSDEEKHQVLVGWNNNPKTYDKVVPVYRLFEDHVAEQPDAIAARYQDEALTYDELNRQANRLARYLIKAGVDRDKIVAILASRSIEYLIAILAIHKAGGAFLPLDPKHPANRLSGVLEHSQAVMILIDEDFRAVAEEAIQPLEDKPNIVRIGEGITSETEDTNIPQRCEMTDLAYVMFTSGSTGKPKGVMVEHLGMLNHNHAKVADLEMGKADTLAQNGPQTFDIMAWQFVAALMVGATVHIIPDEIAHNPVALLHFVNDHKITVLQLVPVLLEAMVQEAQQLGDKRPSLDALKWMVPTGDALPTELCREWLKLYPDIPLMNTYGSTECSDDQCHFPIYDVAPDYRLPIMTIGRPIFNMQIYVLDKWLKPVPIGVVGELYVGGIGVGRGYLKDPERTAQAFLKDPFSDDDSAMLYKTGDQGRYLPDGTIEFLGRVDFMVKVRGFRIELGEIEAGLSKHEAIKQRIVTVFTDERGSKHLVAYVVFHDGQRLTIDDLRAHLNNLLPEYMVPAFYIDMEALPLNSNGKVDRKLLPPPDIARAREESYIAPRTPVEKRLAAIWAEALKLERVGIQDNFFELGGHSILAIRIFAQIEKGFGQSLPLAVLFRAPTIKELGAVLDGSSAQTLESLNTTVVPIRQSGSKQPFFCVGGGVINMNNLAQQLGEDRPFYALQWQNLSVEEIMYGSVESAAEAFVTAMRSVQPTGPYYLGGSFASGIIAVEMARQLQAMGEEVAMLIGFDAIVASHGLAPLQSDGSPKPKRSRIQKIINLVRKGDIATVVKRIREYDYIEFGQQLVWSSAYRLFTRMGKPIPLWMRTGIYEEFCILRATSQHHPREKYQGDLRLFLTPDRYQNYGRFPRFSWEHFVAGDVQAQITPGDPCSIMLNPNVNTLADKLRTQMEQ